MTTLHMDLERALAALALHQELLPPAQAIGIINTARAAHEPLTQALLEAVPENDLLAAIAAELELPFVDLFASSTTYRVDESVLRQTDATILQRHNAIPLRDSDDTIVLALANPIAEITALDYLRSIFPGAPAALASRTQIEAKLAMVDSGSYTPPAADGSGDGDGELSAGSGSEVVDWVDKLLARAAAQNASDVHLNYQANSTLRLRMRVDGSLRVMTVPPWVTGREGEVIGALLAKCSTLDPSNIRASQDGTFSFTANNRKLDARLNLTPAVNGPSIVVRLLDPRNVARRIDAMDFSERTVTQMRDAMSRTQGMVLMVGPTGSGKTTTQYALINELDRDALNILTAEDPVEYRLDGLNQTQIRSGLGEKSLTFAKALRSFLRADPDVILVGEIRDTETAEVAMHAAMTGHLVLSTLHANSALGVITRLAELEVEAFTIAESLSLAVSQRLIKVAHSCATAEAPTAQEAAFLTRHDLPVPEQVVRVAPTGCGGCGGTGYEGRVAVVEVLAPTDEVRTLISARATQPELLQAVRASGQYSSLMEDAYRHVLTMSTPVSELAKCVGQ